MLNFNRYFRPQQGFNWLSSQLTIQSICEALLVLAFFGLLPASWSLGIPVGLAYLGTKIYLHRRTLGQYLSRQVQALILFSRNWLNQTAEAFGAGLVNNPEKVAKAILSFVILFTTSGGVSFIALYALYRFPLNKWIEVFVDRQQNAAEGALGFIEGVSRRLSFQQKMICMIAVSICMTGTALMSGYDLLMAIDWIISSGLAMVGMTAICYDLAYFAKNPLEFFTNHIGKVYGLLLGRSLAFRLFPGKIQGVMGPAIGQVDTTGLMSALLGQFAPTRSWFTFFRHGGGWLTLLGARLHTFIYSIWFSIFFTYDMRLVGDFRGTIGPTHFQIFLCMGIGLLVGYAVERVMHHLYVVLEADAKVLQAHGQEHGQRSLERGKQLKAVLAERLYAARWQIGFVLGTTPLILLTPVGIGLTTLMGGRMLISTAFIMGVNGALTWMGTKVFRKLSAMIGRRQGAQAHFMPESQQEPRLSTHTNTLNTEPVITITPYYRQQLQSERDRELGPLLNPAPNANEVFLPSPSF